MTLFSFFNSVSLSYASNANSCFIISMNSIFFTALVCTLLDPFNK